MRTSLILAAVILAVVLSAPLLSASGAEDGKAGAKPPRVPPREHGRMAGPEHAHRWLAESGATEEQVGKLRELTYRMHLKAIDLEAAVRKAELEFHHLLAGETLDEAKLHAAIDAVSSARAAMAKHAATGFVAASGILGPDLFEKVKGHLIRMHGFGPGFLHGPRGRGHGPRHPGMGPDHRRGPGRAHRDGDEPRREGRNERGGHGRRGPGEPRDR